MAHSNRRIHALALLIAISAACGDDSGGDASPKTDAGDAGGDASHSGAGADSGPSGGAGGRPSPQPDAGRDSGAPDAALPDAALPDAALPDAQMTADSGSCPPDAVEDCATPEDDDCDGEANEAEDGCACVPGSEEDCYTGPEDTLGVGVCRAGKRTCNTEGTGWGACTGEVLPAAETCDTIEDDDCDGDVNEDGAGCSCEPGTMASCYSGPAGTAGVSFCLAGTQICNESGTGYGPCSGEVLPELETCNTEIDDDCDGETNEEGAGCVCLPNSTANCYSGPSGTANVGICHAGTQQCNAQGTAYGPCTGEVLPATETCNTPDDDDCDGETNESGAGCVCLPHSPASCYSGPDGTAGVGLCKSGTRTCNAQGTGYGACMGEVVPVTESCSTPGDDDCDGQANEGCAATYSGDVQPILAAKCSPCHTTNGSGNANFATSYADSQLSSYYCPGKTKGACTIVRIQEGSMPQGRGCTGNPATDAANASCLTAAQQATIQSWITGGQLP